MAKTTTKGPPKSLTIGNVESASISARVASKSRRVLMI